MTKSGKGRSRHVVFVAAGLALALGAVSLAATNKPPLHAKKWMAVTGKPIHI